MLDGQTCFSLFKLMIKVMTIYIYVYILLQERTIYSGSAHGLLHYLQVPLEGFSIPALLTTPGVLPRRTPKTFTVNTRAFDDRLNSNLFRKQEQKQYSQQQDLY